MGSKVTILPKNVRIPTAKVLDSSDSELYGEIRAKTAEKFGEGSRAYATVMDGINPGKATGSQFFFNTEAGLYLPKGQRVATLDDWDAIWTSDPTFLRGNYSDVSAIVLRSETPTYEKNTQVLGDLAKQAKDRDLEFSPENPLIVRNPTLVADTRSENKYGLLIKLSENPEDTSNDSRFASETKSFEIGGSNSTLWTKSGGLSRVYLSRSGNVDSGNDDLSNSIVNGRVVVFDAEGVALEDFVESEVRPYQEKVRAAEAIFGKS